MLKIKISDRTKYEAVAFGIYIVLMTAIIGLIKIFA